jgi:hypothetical protein
MPSVDFMEKLHDDARWAAREALARLDPEVADCLDVVVSIRRSR